MSLGPNAFVDATMDFPVLGMDRLESLPLAMLQCCRTAHLIQEAVDPVTGETQGLTFKGGWRQWRAVDGGSDAMCPVCMMMDSRGEPCECDAHQRPKVPGVCQSCWIESHDPNFANCDLHMTNRKIAGVIGCPICALDPSEAKRCKDHVAKMADVARERPAPDFEDDVPTVAQHYATTIYVVAGTGNAEIRAAALARRAAERAARG